MAFIGAEKSLDRLRAARQELDHRIGPAE